MTAPFTLQMLIDANACSEQVERFKATFGDSVNVTVARARKVAGLFHWNFGRRYLDAEGMAEYNRQLAAIRAKYERQDAAIWAEYERQSAPIWAEYERQLAAIWAEYERQLAPIWATAYIATCKRKGEA